MEDIVRFRISTGWLLIVSNIFLSCILPTALIIPLDLLEITIVDAKGKTRTLNQYTDPDYFYAIRGGGGNSWGVSRRFPQNHNQPLLTQKCST